MLIEQMQLAPTARKAAQYLLEKHPYIVFTSGRRDATEQAHAMACNVITDAKWIMRTYIRGATLQTAIDTYRLTGKPWTIRAIENVLSDAMHTLTDAELGSLSRHFTGDAFDVQPISGPQGENVLDTIHWLKTDADAQIEYGLEKFLTKEGDLIRWHLQFIPSIEV